MKKAELEGVTPHTLRHTLGSAAASAGEALLMVGSILGHSNARSTQIYAHVAHDPARSAADRVTGPLADALGLGAYRSEERRGGKECGSTGSFGVWTYTKKKKKIEKEE